MTVKESVDDELVYSSHSHTPLYAQLLSLLFALQLHV